MRIFDIIAWILLLIGGINWGLVALDYNLIWRLCGPNVAFYVYAAIGVAAVYTLFRKKCCAKSNNNN